MDNRQRTNKLNSVKKANFLSSLFLWYTWDIFSKSNRKNLTFDDLYDTLKNDESEYLGNLLEKEWNRELRKHEALVPVSKGKKVPRPSLTRALIHVFFWQNASVALLNFIGLTTVVFEPVFHGWLIRHFMANEGREVQDREHAVRYASYIVLAQFLTILTIQHACRLGFFLGMRMRVGCCTLIYRKSLRLNKSVLDKTAAGQVVNLMSNDVSRFDTSLEFFNHIWIAPIQVLIILYMMWGSVGALLFVGVAVLLIIAIPLQSTLTYMSNILREKIAILTDKRIQMMSELISGIQVIKMYAWEIPFRKIINTTRAAEMKKIVTSSYMMSIHYSSLVLTDRLTIFATLVLFVLTGHKLTAEVSFVMAKFYALLQLMVINLVPVGLVNTSETMISIKRIEEFLLLDEIETPPKKNLNLLALTDSEVSDKVKKRINVTSRHSCTPIEVIFRQVSANWKLAQLPPTLNELTFKIEAGSLCALVGKVGSGKTAVLNLLLKELSLGAGSILLRKTCDDEKNYASRNHGFHVEVPNLKISYASQDAWLFSGTVRENILFGQIYDPVRYNDVTEVCALHHDFEQLSQGDMTVVGERGTSLSGGQRARINLARAIYREANIYLLDDPLSAVDPRVARRIFEKCMNGFLRGKTRILVTHQLQFLRGADSILFLERGMVKYFGSYENITNMHHEITEFLDKFNVTGSNNQKNLTTEDETHERDNLKSSIEISDEGLSKEPATASPNELEMHNATYGYVTLLKMYVTSGSSWCFLTITMIVMVLAQVTLSGCDWWLGYWTHLEDQREIKTLFKRNAGDPFGVLNDTKLDIANDHGKLMSTNYAIHIYTGILITCIVLIILKNSLIMKMCMNASIQLHKKMFENLIHATMNYFTKNPSGQILNRFSKDIGAVDEKLSHTLTETLQTVSLMLGVAVIVSTVKCLAVLPILVIVVLFIGAQKIYMATVQEIKRLETSAKSPVFSHVNSTFNGLATIRSYGDGTKTRLVREFDRYQDEHSSAWSLTILTSTAFGLFVELVLVILNALIVYGLVFLNSGDVTGSSVGLVLSQISALNGMVQYSFRTIVETVFQLTSVERIIQYTGFPKEQPLKSPNPLPQNWPQSGRVSLRNVSVRYEEDKPVVLKNVNVEIESGWKVGIVGRTGAGKSSVIGALFRLANEHLDGEILIDGIDTRHVGLLDLRERISVIPQEPVLFTQSLRYNLDPFGKYDDSVLLDALREVELHNLTLDHQVAEKGSNFSVGQRQLTCLARAIVRQNKILVLDEATANIDTHTDSIIQSTIRTRFSECTVLTVAHRLSTVIDSDRIIVMDDGCMVEFGHPHELLKNNPDGYLFRMIRQMGETTAEKLADLAEQSYFRSQQLGVRENTEDNEKTILLDDNYDIRL